MNEDFSACVSDELDLIEQEISYTDASSYSESDSEQDLPGRRLSHLTKDLHKIQPVRADTQAYKQKA